SLLEAQAATGRFIDPYTAQRMSVQEAKQKGLIDKQFEDILLRAERAVYGYKTKLSTETLSLCEAMKRGLVLENHGIRLLEAQIATGGIVDPNANHRLPVRVAYKRGLFDERLNKILQDPSDDTKCFFDPTTQENLTYNELMKRCVIDKDTGLRLLPFRVKKKTDPRPPKVMINLVVTSPTSRRVVIVDPNSGNELTVQEALKFKLIDEATAAQLMAEEGDFQQDDEGNESLVVPSTSSIKQHDFLLQKGKINVEEPLVMGDTRTLFLQLVFKLKYLWGNSTKLPKVIKEAPNQIITVECSTGISPSDRRMSSRFCLVKKTIQPMALMSFGNSPIAGIIDMATNKKMTFFHACQQGIIRKGTAISLLEAQAATGSIIEPNTGEKMSVNEAKVRGLIDREFEAVLVRAERAVLGFKTRLSSNPLSLFEAMNRKLVVESHGIRLLEAQIATGGIIDPFANHRLPVEVAFERGFFDRRLQKILDDPSDDTKGFFDPNTNENITYLELVQRCIIDRKTDLPLLQ
uniref:Uncharacterized protein n=1 Tax=Ciona savignyi TaxID=51511 RepID=H2ZEQ9_CIOSA